MERKILVILFGLISFITQGQQQNCNCKYYPVKENVLEDKLISITLSDDNIKLPDGEIYSQWSRGNIILNNGKIIHDRIIRYNGLSDQLVVNSITENINLVVEKSTIKGFDLQLFNTDKIIHYKRMSIQSLFSSDYNNAFLQVLVSGKTSLYAYRRLQQIGSTDDLQMFYSYVIVKEDGSSYHFLMYSRKFIASLFPEKIDIFKPQLRKRHNRIRNEEQLIKAIELINSL